MRKLRLELVVDDESCGETSSSGGIVVVQQGQHFEFSLCRKETQLGDHSFDHYWMDQRTVYPGRGRRAANFEAIVDHYWALCRRAGSDWEADVKQSYALARLLPHARDNGARRVFVDAHLRRRKASSEIKLQESADSERVLNAGSAERFTEAEFRDSTASAIGPPQHEQEVYDCYNRMQAELFGELGNADARGGADCLDEVIGRWTGWMQNIGRHSGHQLEKQVLDILSYECRAALHRCYSAVWHRLIDEHGQRLGLDSRSQAFHRFWHLEQSRPTDETDLAYFHLFHGHVFALHPAAALFIQTATGGRLMGEWLGAPKNLEAYERLLHGLAVAVHLYAQRRGVYAELRKQQPGYFVDMVSLEESREECRRGRRRSRRRGTDAR